MNDTSPRAEALVLRLLREKTPEERFLMMCGMWAASRAFMEAGLRAEGLVPDSVAWKVATLDRTYGSEISPKRRAQLIARWTALANQG